MYKILFLILFSSGAMFGLSVEYTPTNLLCGTTTITGDFDCNFNGIVQISISGGVIHNQGPLGPLVNVSGGIMTFDITIDATDSSPFIISGEVKNTNMPVCAAVDEPFSTSLTHGCTPAPINDLCAGAELLSINFNSCTYNSFETANQTYSGVASTCGGSAGYSDLWYEFVANSSNVTVELGSYPGNIMIITLYNGCGGSQHACDNLFVALGDTDTEFTGLTMGNTYKIQVLTFASSSGGMQEICLQNDIPLAIEDIRLSLTNHPSYNELVFNSSEEVNLIKVERKLNEEPEFQIIGELDVEGENIYTFKDEDLDDSGLYTYRLKIYDMDGIASYSNLVSTNHTKGNKFGLKAFPNPCSDIINFRTGSILSKQDDLTIQILNSDLKAIKTIHNFNSAKTQSVDISELNNGIYFARILSNVKHKMVKFVKI